MGFVLVFRAVVVVDVRMLVVDAFVGEVGDGDVRDSCMAPGAMDDERASSCSMSCWMSASLSLIVFINSSRFLEDRE